MTAKEFVKEKFPEAKARHISSFTNGHTWMILLDEQFRGFGKTASAAWVDAKKYILTATK